MMQQLFNQFSVAETSQKAYTMTVIWRELVCVPWCAVIFTDNSIIELIHSKYRVFSKFICSKRCHDSSTKLGVTEALVDRPSLSDLKCKRLESPTLVYCRVFVEHKLRTRTRLIWLSPGVQKQLVFAPIC